MKFISLIAVAFFASARSIGQTGPYGLATMHSLSKYRASVAADSNQALVPLKGYLLDIRYATPDNLMHRPVYDTALAFLRRPAAEALQAAESELKPLGYGLKIFDGYRPYRVTVEFWEAYRDSTFVASPYTGSRHNRGCAVDLTLIDLRTGNELEMPTAYDAFTPRAAAMDSLASPRARKNRALLQKVMLANGFLILPSEWWHFDYGGWKAYPVTDIPFRELVGGR